MMSDPTMVDGTTVDELTGKLVLIIDEQRAWREADLMHRQLAAKVKNYVRHIRSPEFTAEHGKSPKSTIIRLVSTEPPPEASLKFFERVAYELDKFGVTFEHQLGETGVPATISPSDATLPSRKPPGPRPQARTTGAAPSAPSAPSSAPDSRREPPPTPRQPSVPPVPPEAKPSEADLPPPQPRAAESEPATRPQEPEARPREPATRPQEPETRPPRPGVPPEEPGPTPTTRPPATTPAAGEAKSPELEQPVQPPVAESPGKAEAVTSRPTDFDAQEIIDRAQKKKKEAPSPPPFFPEEEFGRSIPDLDDVETALAAKPDHEDVVIESASGEEYVVAVDVPEGGRRKPKTRRVRSKEGPSLVRAALAALWAAVAGAMIWGLLAIPASNGASLLAVAVAIMVGFNVRLRGNGHTLPFRLIGAVGTLLGSVLGGVLASAALTAVGVGLPIDPEPGQPVGVNAALHVLSEPDATITAITRYYGLLDVVAIVVAVYVAFRLSVAKSSS